MSPFTHSHSSLSIHNDSLKKIKSTKSTAQNQNGSIQAHNTQNGPKPSRLVEYSFLFLLLSLHSFVTSFQQKRKKRWKGGADGRFEFSSTVFILKASYEKGIKRITTKVVVVVVFLRDTHGSRKDLFLQSICCFGVAF